MSNEAFWRLATGKLAKYEKLEPHKTQKDL
jgi:hypothetical protein